MHVHVLDRLGVIQSGTHSGSQGSRRCRYFFTQPAFTPTIGSEGLYDDKDKQDPSPSRRREGWLDTDAMREASHESVGLHDFRNFCKTSTSRRAVAQRTPEAYAPANVYLAPKAKPCIFLFLDMPADPMARLVMRNEGLHGARDAMVRKTTLWHKLKVGVPKGVGGMP